MAWADWNESIKLVDSGDEKVAKERTEYVCSSSSDLTDLPTDLILMGSIALTIADGKLHIWDGTQWVEQ